MGVLRRIFSLERLRWNAFVLVTCYWLLAFGLSVLELSAENWKTWWNPELFRESAWREGESIYGGWAMRCCHKWVESEGDFAAVFAMLMVITSFIKGVKVSVLGWIIKKLLKKLQARWSCFWSGPPEERKEFLRSFEWLPSSLLIGVSIYWGLAFLSVFNGGRKWLDWAMFKDPGELLSRGVFDIYSYVNVGKRAEFMESDTSYLVLLLCLSWLLGCVAYFLGLRAVEVLKTKKG
ncbi:hypothetical protein Rhal01_01516 [Rubritalea halochordaticola]|uniref:DUF4328 domain-containing protein n=1 Tax=Rubritalea halochordaticola TaxID=714537 RepID=A0ABP9UY18_9BACT